MPSGIYQRIMGINCGFNKGRHHTEETKRKISQTLRGRKGRIGGFLGKKHTEATKRKMREASNSGWFKKGQLPSFTSFQKGHIPWNKGKKLPEGVITKEAKRKMSEAKKGKIPLNWKTLYTPEINEKRRLARLKQKLPTFDTSIERKFEAYLKENKINYIHPFNLGNRFQCDFYLPFLNLIVECDGTYWHSRPDMKRRDKSKDAYAKKCGFNMLRLTEEQINQGRFFCGFWF